MPDFNNFLFEKISLKRVEKAFWAFFLPSQCEKNLMPFSHPFVFYLLTNEILLYGSYRRFTQFISFPRYLKSWFALRCVRDDIMDHWKEETFCCEKLYCENFFHIDIYLTFACFCTRLHCLLLNLHVERAA